MKKEKISVKHCAIAFLNTLLIVFDLIILLIIIGSLVGALCALVYIINVLFSNANLQNDCAQDQLTLWLEILSISITCFLAPFLSALISIFVEKNKEEKQISESLAEGNNVRFYLLKLPLGAWHNLSSAYYEATKKHTPNKIVPLSKFCYAMHLVFRGNIFQVFQIKALQLGYIVDSKEYSIWTRTRTRTRTQEVDNSTECIISDSTGVEQPTDNAINGTNITILLEDHEQLLQDQFINLIDHDLVVSFDFSFSLREDRFNIRWKQFSQCCFWFPIIRSVCDFCLSYIKKHRIYRYKLHLNNYVFTDERNAQLCYNIYDINVGNKRTPTKFKRVKAR